MIASHVHTLRKRLTGRVPQILFEVDRLSSGAPVLIVDHPRQMRIVVDDREMSLDGARYLTAAANKHVANGPWHRDNTGLWIQTTF